MTMSSFKVIPPGAWLGMLGGGQLGRMFVHAAQAMGYRVVVLDPAEQCPAADAADLHIRAAYDSPEGLAALAQRCVAVTTEFENVPAASLAALAETLQVSPAAEAVSIAQDRMAEKAFVRGQGVRVAPYADIHAASDLASAPAALFPGILKAARLGYDGKGQARVNSLEEAQAAFVELGSVPCVLEARLPLKYEVSVVVARGFNGRSVSYPLSQNEHRDGILAVSTVPAPAASDAVSDDIRGAALRLVDGLNYHGVLCIEFFVLEDGSWVVNEMAPRPHNSGHYTIDACVCSQFEQQVRAMTGMPLGATRVMAPSVMLNVLGDSWFTAGAEAREPAWSDVLAQPEAKLHLYGKTQARPGRKMGHVTCLGQDLAEARQTAAAVAATLGIAF